MALSFNSWTEGKVAATTHDIKVLPPPTGPPEAPVSDKLIASLVHPDRQSAARNPQFSPDGSLVLFAGYRSGIVQVWDWRAQREVRRVETPPGGRSSGDYALVTPDWQTLYVSRLKRKVTQEEQDGRRVRRLACSGDIGCWDLVTGKEKAALPCAPGYGPPIAGMSPDGRFLWVNEISGDDQSATYVWNLQKRTKHKLVDSCAWLQFTSDARFAAGVVVTENPESWTLHLYDTTTGQSVANVSQAPDKCRYMVDRFCGPANLIAVRRDNEIGGAPGYRFFDGQTLAERGRFDGVAMPGMHAAIACEFTPDGRVCVIHQYDRTVALWDTAASMVADRLDVESNVGKVCVSPDGSRLAIAHQPKVERSDDVPEFEDYPQARITFFDLATRKPLQTLVAPRGMIDGLAFSPDGKTLAIAATGALHVFDVSK